MGPEEIAGVQLMCCWAFSRKGTKPLQVGRPKIICPIPHSGGIPTASTTSLLLALSKEWGWEGQGAEPLPVTLSLRLEQGTG